LEARKPQQVKPVGVALSRHQFRRAFAHSFFTFAPHELTVILEKLEEIQVRRPQLLAQEEVVPQTIGHLEKLKDFMKKRGIRLKVREGEDSIKTKDSSALCQKAFNCFRVFPLQGICLKVSIYLDYNY